MIRYEITNPEEIPSDLPLGEEYDTKVVSATLEEGVYVIRLKYLGPTTSPGSALKIVKDKE